MQTVDKNYKSPSPMIGLEDFDRNSGSLIERFCFNYRLFIVIAAVLITVFLGYYSSKLEIKASYQDMMPRSHEYVENYLNHARDIGNLGESLRIVITNESGKDIYDESYISTLRDINDEVFLFPGVDRSFMRSLWMPVVRWSEITPEGFDGGPVMPTEYDGSPDSIRQLKENVHRSGIVGSLVGTNQQSSMLFVPLINSESNPLDYASLYQHLEELRYKYESEGVSIKIIGFAQLVGDLTSGLTQVLSYFFIAFVLSFLILVVYTKSLKCTLMVTTCSLIAVIWQLGLMQIMGFVLDPFSTLVPFLVFAIGVSHASQKMNGIIQDTERGMHKYVAARFTFRRLFLAGFTAIVADAAGFAILGVIDIPAIRSLAAAASIGVAVLVFTNIILLPILLSYTGVGRFAAAHNEKSLNYLMPAINWLSMFTDKRRAKRVLVGAVLLALGAAYIAKDIKIGDLDSGAPELREDSRYNLDNAYVTENYFLSSDQFAVIVETTPQGLLSYETLVEMDRLEQILRDLPGVQTTVSVASAARRFTTVGFEGSLKWETLNRDPYVLQDAFNVVTDLHPELFNSDRSVAPIIAFLADHKADTLSRLVEEVEAFARTHNTEDRKFLLLAGNSGIEAVTNIVVEKANRAMLFYVYIIIALLCWVTFRSWRAVVVALLPLMLVTILCEALMVIMGIGVKVATLPVVALGVGIGVDYALYLLTMHLAYSRQGNNVKDSYVGALRSTGQVVGLIGFMLSIAVITWAWSPIKFQADMGILLGFIFMANMLAALILIPSLATFILPNNQKNNDAKEGAGAREENKAAVDVSLTG